MIDFNEVLPELYVGSCPEGIPDIEELRQGSRITALLSLQSDEDLRERGLHWPILKEAYRGFEIEGHRVPMRDFDYDDQRRVLPDAVRTLAKLLAYGHTVYLHCNVGVGRSPLVAMAYLYWCRGLVLHEAIRYVEARRPCSPYDDLLEVSRNDLLGSPEAQRMIRERAAEIARERRTGVRDQAHSLAEAEQTVLRELLGLGP